MPTNDFQTFAGDPAANVMLQTDYIASGFTQRVLGFSAGTAVSLQCNKVWRQATMISHMIGQFTCDATGLDMLDDGSPGGLTALQSHFTSAITLTARAAVGVGYLPLAGGTLTGALTINCSNLQLQLSALGNSHCSVGMDRPAGYLAALTSTTSTHPRWQVLFASNEAEVGNNAGSNFYVYRFNDAGTYIDAPITISRATGVVNFSHPPTWAGAAMPYLPLSGGTVTGYLGVIGSGITYPNQGGHAIAYGWDGSHLNAFVDNTYIGALATQSYVGSVAGNYLPVAGGTIYNRFEANCNVTIDGTLWNRATVYFANIADFYISTYSSWRILNWAGSWWDGWDGNTGNRGWWTASGAVMTLDPGATLQVSGNFAAHGGRISCTNYGSVGVSMPGGTSQGMWAASDGMWWGWADGWANPTNGLQRLGNDGVLCNWNGIISYNWMQCSQWMTAGGSIWSSDRVGARSGYPALCMWNTGQGVAGGLYVDSGGIHMNQQDGGGSPASGALFTLNFGGWLFVAGGVGTPSDRSLKSNIQPSEVDSLAAIRRIKHYSYDMADRHVQLGMIADEVQPVLPDVVIPGPGGENYLDHIALIAHSYKAIIQLAQEIDTMKRS